MVDSNTTSATQLQPGQEQQEQHAAGQQQQRATAQGHVNLAGKADRKNQLGKRATVSDSSNSPTISTVH